ncbi:MAG TPA: Zn-ribbon domain-containing OB-fold protein [Actinomycetota bacterium]|nr:Zn-ribbon domain-containing OB-fold protein [Actinomycetota bacterium]
METVQTPPYTTAGHSLTDEDFRKAVGAVDFAVDARYAWDTGVAVGEFLRGLKDGRILARECRKCRRILVPPRMFCEQDFRPTDRWVQVQDTGRINTFSICYIRWDMVKLEQPELPAVIEIDGASPGIGIMHKLGEVEPDDVRIGMEVEAVWKPEDEREGSILDILYFRPRDASLRRGGRRKGRRQARPPAERPRRRRDVGGAV